MTHNVTYLGQLMRLMGVYPKYMYFLYSFLASGTFRHLLITFANSLDPDQDR